MGSARKRILSQEGKGGDFEGIQMNGRCTGYNIEKETTLGILRIFHYAQAGPI
jgi:hypothetical protein